MVNIHIPVCGLFLSILIFIIFVSKKNVKTVETKLFSYLIFANLLNAIMTVVIIYFGYKTPNFNLLFVVLNRIDFLSYIVWVSSFFLYIYHISSKGMKISYEKMYKIVFLIDIIVYLFTLFLPVYIFNDGYMYSYGAAVTFLYVSVGIYMLLILVYAFINYKYLISKKYIPLFSLIAIVFLTMIVRKINPGLLVISSVISYLNLIMLFTIENPDIKLLEELHKSKEISDNANEEKTLFLYNMTQEIRHITSKIDDDADLILGSKNWDETYDTARDIKANTSKFTSMTNDILDVSTIDSANMKKYNNKYNIKNIFKQVINVYNDTCKSKGIDFRTNIDHNVPESLYGDGIGLKEVLTIVLNNSTKYTTSGYVEFSVNTIIKNDICRLIITIEDSGPGIKSEDINKIKIEDNSLSKANKLITTMNGTMLISSDYGIGTKVKVILDQKMVEVENSEVAKYDSTFDNIAILTVDDSESGLKIVEKLLKGTNVKLDMALTGKECLDKLKINKYDLIMIDEALSQISGIELMEKVNEIRNFNAPVVLLTKDNSYEYNEEYLKKGFAGYILKPLKKEILLEKINKYTKKDKK